MNQTNIKEILENLNEDELQIVREFVVSKFKNLITEMAFDRKTVMKKIDGLEKPLNLHLIKIIRYKDDINFSKHLKDIKTWLVTIQKLDVGKKDKKLSEKEYFKLLFEQPFTDNTNSKRILNYEKSDLKHYLNLPRIRDEKETVQMLYTIQKIIAKKLANDDIWDIDEVIVDLIKN